MIIYYTFDEMSRFFKQDMEKNEAVHQLILGNLKHARKKAEAGEKLDEGLRFGAIFDGDVPVYYFNNTPPFNMVIMPVNPKNPADPKRFGKELAEEFNTNGVAISGIQSIYEFCVSFNEHFNRKLTQTMGMDIMVATDIRKYPLVGDVVRANMDDFREICALYYNFVKDALGEERPMSEISEQVRIKLSTPNTYVWLYRVNGKLVGMNMSTRQLEHGACVNGVYIVPEERKKGYCKQMVSWSSQYYLDNGFDYVTLYVDKANPFSNAAYSAIGYDYICSAYCFEEE